MQHVSSVQSVSERTRKKGQVNKEPVNEQQVNEDPVSDFHFRLREREKEQEKVDPIFYSLILCLS